MIQRHREREREREREMKEMNLHEGLGSCFVQQRNERVLNISLSTMWWRYENGNMAEVSQRDSTAREMKDHEDSV